MLSNNIKLFGFHIYSCKRLDLQKLQHSLAKFGKDSSIFYIFHPLELILTAFWFLWKLFYRRANDNTGKIYQTKVFCKPVYFLTSSNLLIKKKQSEVTTHASGVPAVGRGSAGNRKGNCSMLESGIFSLRIDIDDANFPCGPSILYPSNGPWLPQTVLLLLNQ